MRVATVETEPGIGLTAKSDDIESEGARLKAEGVPFRNEVITGPGGSQVLICDPSGNFVELFQPAASPA